MMRKIIQCLLCISALMAIFSCRCECSDKCNCGNHCSCEQGGKCNEECPCGVEITKQRKQTVNIYVENSGSMQGFFSGESQIKDVIKEFYDRIDEKMKQGKDSSSVSDTITLNYISTKIVNENVGIKKFLSQSYNRCTESYSKIDDILKMAMESTNDSTVSIVVSDFSFTSDDASFSMARSGITNVFAKQLEQKKHMSVAIYKFISNFTGYYYPGRIPCRDKKLPFYVWVFGNEQQVKQIVTLPIRTEHCGYMALQPNLEISPLVKAQGRMVKNNSIVVGEWGADRSSQRDEKNYTVKIETDLSPIILPSDSLMKNTSYEVSDGYAIKEITREEDIYTFTILTRKPSPGEINVRYNRGSLLLWVENSNFEGKGVPKDSTTYGVKHLLSGVYDAYNNKSNVQFEFNINVIK